MTWKNHRFFTAAGVFLISADPIASIVAAGASTFPDAIEGIDYSKQRYQKHHRKGSHWWLPYAIVMFLTWMFSGAQMPLTVATNIADGRIDLAGPGLIMFASSIGFCLALGGFAHILEDAICGRVPLFNPKKQTFGIKLFKVRSVAEDIFAMGCGVAMILIRLLWIGVSWTPA